MIGYDFFSLDFVLSLHIQKAFSLIYFPAPTTTTSEINGSLNVAQPSTFSSALLCLNHCQLFQVFYVYVAFWQVFFFRIILCISSFTQNYSIIIGSLTPGQSLQSSS